jgi:hypothetical protein
MLKTREGARLRKVNGGCPKLQGIWIPYEDALVLSRRYRLNFTIGLENTHIKCRYAYNIRSYLVPLFGYVPNISSLIAQLSCLLAIWCQHCSPSFPDSCIPTDPDQYPDSIQAQSNVCKNRRSTLDIVPPESPNAYCNKPPGPHHRLDYSGTGK